MSVAAAIRITSPDEEHVIGQASSFAQQHGQPLFVISVVSELPYGPVDDDQSRIVARNLKLISAANASPLIQEGDDVPRALLAIARSFGVRVMFLQAGTTKGLGRSIAERLLYLQPSFDVIVLPPK